MRSLLDSEISCTIGLTVARWRPFGVSYVAHERRISNPQHQCLGPFLISPHYCTASRALQKARPILASRWYSSDVIRSVNAFIDALLSLDVTLVQS